ncbi:hypothetical protein ACQKL5_06055 [Peribacillus sp. NPDC097675]|uniref:hypothetical protein n=1 Tax=Peribacillus sp. NPDC097675 TaxID=3390618 RepID=UPI003CFD6EFF
MSDNINDKKSKPLLYVDQVEVKAQRGNMQSDYRTKKRKNAESKKTELMEDNQKVEPTEKTEKIEKIKHEFGVYDAMKEIESEISEIKKLTNQYSPEQAPVEHSEEHFEEPPELPAQEKKKIKKKKKVEKVSTSEIITRLSHIKGYPKPVCEAVIHGETVRFQVMGMRGESVKIKRGNHIRFVRLPDILNVKIIEDSN